MASISPVSHTEGDGKPKDNGLYLDGAPFELEKLYDYEPGGHHPVHLGDMLHGRYKVIHKLGSGGYANIWLCRDTSSTTPKYRALKIIMAEGSTEECPELRVNQLKQHLGIDNKDSTSGYFCLPSDQFEINGPNGAHYAFAYPVLGPRVSRLVNLANSEDKDPGSPLRKVCLQVTQALSTLHANGLCHGDFRPANILAHISGLDDLSEDDVLALVGKPKTVKVLKRPSGDEHDLPGAPHYLVYPVDWDEVAENTAGREFIIAKACITDFGESFNTTEPVQDLGIPQVYCPPEYVLDGKVGVGCDLWALGCTLFEIRTGRKLFDTFDEDPDEYLCLMAMVLGRLPEPWWSEGWEGRRELLEDDVDATGKVVEVQRYPVVEQNSGDSQQCVVVQPPEPRSLQEALSVGLFYEGKYGPEGIHRAIPEDEIEVFSDLLSKLLSFDPEDRLTASQALEHEWFKM
ncbi:hypothetical protein SLS62_000664 [Diatrype stigma]|uniref:Protein kinase domain-containing protein n=1 Tax=Diatrype stigma TaxID=117547 RepID=A0AAN9V2A4_9PEZI